MTKKLTEKDIIRFIELTDKISVLTDERDEIRDMIIDDCMEVGTPDDEKDNVFHVKIGKSTATLTIIVERRFNSAKFKKEHDKMYESYRETNTKNKVTATSDR